MSFHQNIQKALSKSQRQNDSQYQDHTNLFYLARRLLQHNIIQNISNYPQQLQQAIHDIIDNINHGTPSDQLAKSNSTPNQSQWLQQSIRVAVKPKILENLNMRIPAMEKVINQYIESNVVNNNPPKFVISDSTLFSAIIKSYEWCEAYKGPTVQKNSWREYKERAANFWNQRKVKIIGDSLLCPVFTKELSKYIQDLSRKYPSKPINHRLLLLQVLEKVAVSEVKFTNTKLLPLIFDRTFTVNGLFKEYLRGLLEEGGFPLEKKEMNRGKFMDHLKKVIQQMRGGNGYQSTHSATTTIQSCRYHPYKRYETVQPRAIQRNTPFEDSYSNHANPRPVRYNDDRQQCVLNEPQQYGQSVMQQRNDGPVQHEQIHGGISSEAQCRSMGERNIDNPIDQPMTDYMYNGRHVPTFNEQQTQSPFSTDTPISHPSFPPPVNIQPQQPMIRQHLQRQYDRLPPYPFNHGITANFYNQVQPEQLHRYPPPEYDNECKSQYIEDCTQRQVTFPTLIHTQTPHNYHNNANFTQPQHQYPLNEPQASYFNVQQQKQISGYPETQNINNIHCQTQGNVQQQQQQSQFPNFTWSLMEHSHQIQPQYDQQPQQYQVPFHTQQQREQIEPHFQNVNDNRIQSPLICRSPRTKDVGITGRHNRELHDSNPTVWSDLHLKDAHGECDDNSCSVSGTSNLPEEVHSMCHRQDQAESPPVFPTDGINQSPDLDWSNDRDLNIHFCSQ